MNIRTPGELQEAASDPVSSVLRTLDIARKGMDELREAVETGPLGEAVGRAVELIHGSSGRLIVTGVGKSGHIGRKLAATLSSTGTPAYFVHPTEAVHGDLGMIANDDVILALSWSGETQELGGVVQYAQRFGVKLVSITSKANSTLARASTVPLVLPRALESCPLGLAPTTSTLLQLAVGDAIAIALLELRNFSATDFRNFHPGGKLGAQLKLVRDLMRSDDAAPLLPRGTKISEAILAMTASGFGVAGIVSANGDLDGIITDGDLRRHMGVDLLGQTVEDVMSANPKVVASDVFAAEALKMMHSGKITVLFVVEGRAPIGIVRLHDLLREGVA